MNHLRVLSLNTWNALDPQIPALMLPLQRPRHYWQRIRAQGEALRKLRETAPGDLDVFCLQELNPAGLRARFLKKKLQMEGAVFRANPGARIGPLGLPLLLCEGLGILTGGTLAEATWEGRALSGWAWQKELPGGMPVAFQLSERRCAFQLSGVYAGLRIGVVNLHLHHGPANEYSRRLAELRVLADWLREQEKRYDWTFVCGDFNAGPDSPELAPLRELGFEDTARLAGLSEPLMTWDPLRNPFCAHSAASARDLVTRAHDSARLPLDRIYFRAGKAAAARARPSFEVLRVFDEAPVSDHYGVLCSVRWE